MQTTTIRVDVDTHRRLVALSERHGQPLGATVRLAAEALDRNDLTNRIAAQLDRLHDDPAAWASYMAENESLGSSEGIA
jgi:predicted DNA-binding protein